MPFPNNTIPASLIDPNAVLYLNTGIIPKSNTSTDHNIDQHCRTRSMLRDDIVRVDHKWNDKWQILGHYMHDSVTQGYALPFLGWLWASYNTVTSTLSNPSNSRGPQVERHHHAQPAASKSSINYDGNIINITNSANANKPSGWSVKHILQQRQRSICPALRWGGPYYVAEEHGFRAVAQRG